MKDKKVTYFTLDDIYYMTQYASSSVSDKAVLDRFNNNLYLIESVDEKLKYKEQIIKLAKKMPDVHDNINAKIFKELYYGDTNFNNLKKYESLLDILNSEGDDWIYKSDNLLKFGANEFFEQDGIINKDVLWDVIASDLREFDLDSRWIYSINSFFKSIDCYKSCDYVYVDAYLQVNELTNEEIKSDYISALSDLDIDEILELETAKDEEKVSDAFDADVINKFKESYLKKDKQTDKKTVKAKVK